MKKQIVALVLSVMMFTTCLVGCGNAEQTTSNQSEVETMKEVEEQQESHNVGDVYTVTLNGKEIEFQMYDFPYHGIEMPVPYELMDMGRWFSGVRDEEDYINKIETKILAVLDYEYSDANGYFMFIVGQEINDEDCKFLNEDGSCNISDDITMEKASELWWNEGSAYTFTTEPLITNHKNDLLSVSFSTPIKKGAYYNGENLKTTTWNGYYNAIKGEKNVVELIFGNSNLDNETILEINNYMIENITFKDIKTCKSNIGETEVVENINGQEYVFKNVEIPGTNISLPYNEEICNIERYLETIKEDISKKGYSIHYTPEWGFDIFPQMNTMPTGIKDVNTYINCRLNMGNYGSYNSSEDTVESILEKIIDFETFDIGDYTYYVVTEPYTFTPSNYEPINYIATKIMITNGLESKEVIMHYNMEEKNEEVEKALEIFKTHTYILDYTVE